MTRLLYSKLEAAEQLSISLRTLNRLLADKTCPLPTVKVGRRVLISAEALTQYVERLRESA